MKKLVFKETINAPREKVWIALWDDKNYREWTEVFHPGSYAETDWKEGSKILFLTPEGDGMYSTIARKIENEYMAFRHLGEIKNGQEIPLDWGNVTENYTLKQAGSGTELLADVDMEEKHAGYFEEIFPKALAKVKEIAERS